MSSRVLSKEEFVRRAMADFAASKSVAAPVVQAKQKKRKRKYSWKRTAYTDFDVIERTALYA